MGILPLANGVEAPWTTPPILASFISGGWQWLYIAILLVISIIGYFPLFELLIDKHTQEQTADELTPSN